jgi:hypothetical protein
MNRSFAAGLLGLAVLAVTAAPACSQDSKSKTAPKAEWTTIFDGKSMDGWEFLEMRGKGSSSWKLEDGLMVGTGQPSMMFSPRGDYKNFRVRAEIMINDKGNSGFYFRTAKKASFGDGYEAQVDATHTDPIRTGSIYGFVHVYKPITKPGEWFTYEIQCQDREWRGRTATAIKVTINGDELYEMFDFDNTYKSGHFAFQAHDPGSIVKIRKVEVMELP